MSVTVESWWYAGNYPDWSDQDKGCQYSCPETSLLYIRQKLTKYVQTDDLSDRPPAHPIVSVADVLPGVGPGQVGHAESLARHGLVGAQSPGKGLVMLKTKEVNNMMRRQTISHLSGPVDVWSGLTRGSALQSHTGPAPHCHRPVTTRGNLVDGRRN